MQIEIRVFMFLGVFLHLAGDITRISTSPAQLQKMLDICVEYSNKRRFGFNAEKSCILQFSPTFRELNIKFSCLIAELIPTSNSYTHLGIDINSKLKSIERTTSACRKGRNSFFALNGVSSESTSQSILTRLYKTVVLPTVLYGCE